jgi:hypothetical protein
MALEFDGEVAVVSGGAGGIGAAIGGSVPPDQPRWQLFVS